MWTVCGSATPTDTATAEGGQARTGFSPQGTGCAWPPPGGWETNASAVPPFHRLGFVRSGFARLRVCGSVLICLGLLLSGGVVQAQTERPFTATPLRPVQDPATASPSASGGTRPGSGSPGSTSESGPAGLSPALPESPIPAPGPFFAMWPLRAPPRAGEEVVVHVQLLSALGLPLTGQTVSATLDRGRILQVRESLPGEHEIRLLAPPTELPLTLSLVLETRVEDQPLTQKVLLPVTPKVEPFLALNVEARTLKLGRTRELRLTLTGRHSDNSQIRVEELVLNAVPGRIDRLKTLPDGSVEAWYLPPEDSLPQYGLITAFAGQGAFSLAAMASIELVATANVPIQTEPGAQVSVEVDGKLYGPQKVPSSGSLTVPVSVFPSSQVMIIRATDRAGNKTQTLQDLALPRAPKAQLRLDRFIHRSDEAQSIGVTLVQIDEGGRPVRSILGRLAPGSGQLGGLVERAPGVFVTELIPPSTAGRHELRWEMPDGQILSQSIEVLEGSPAAIALTVAPERIRSDDPPAEISLTVTDRRGQPATAVLPRLEAPLGLLEPLRRIRPGEFVAAWRPPTALPPGMEFKAEGIAVPLTVTVQRLPEAGPVTQLGLRCATPDLRVGGGPTACLARPLNRWGAPVAGVRLLLEEVDPPVPEQVSARFPPLLTTNAQGEAAFVVYPDRQVRAVRLRATVLTAAPGHAHELTDPGRIEQGRIEQGRAGHSMPRADGEGSSGPSDPATGHLDPSQRLASRTAHSAENATLVRAETLLLQWIGEAELKGEQKGQGRSTSLWSAHRAERDRERLEAESGIFTLQRQLTLISSRVRQAELVALPNTLFINARQTSAVTVRLYDHLGKPVADQSLRLNASAGFLTEARQDKETGEYRASYTPPPVLGPDSRVRIVATNPDRDYEAAAEIQLIRPEGRFLGSARIGFLSNFGALTSPMLGMQIQAQVPALPTSIYLGGEIGYYFLDASQVRLDLIPLQLFAVYRYPLGTAAPYAGVGPIFSAVVAQREVFEEEAQAYQTLRSGAALPGVGGKLGLELALGPGGVALELGLTFLAGRSIPELGLDLRENLGGASFSAGYVAHF